MQWHHSVRRVRQCHQSRGPSSDHNQKLPRVPQLQAGNLKLPDSRATDTGICPGERRTGNGNEFPNSNEFSWTARISQHTKSGQQRQALKLYQDMQEAGVKPGSYTFVTALKACSSLRDLESARKIHAQVVESQFQSDVYVGTMLVDVYAKCRSLVDARHVFEQMLCRNVVSWNAMICGYAQMGEGAEALQLYRRMQQEGVVPNDRTFVGALKACSSLSASEVWNKADGKRLKPKCLQQVRDIHLDLLQSGFESDVFVGNMMVDVYSKCGSLADARHVFERMPYRNVVSWTAMIMGYAKMEEGEEALQLYARMQQERVAPDNRALVAALKACSSLMDGIKGVGISRREQYLKLVRAIHKDVVNTKYESDVFVGSMLVDVYAKCLSLSDARSVFEKISHRDVVTWSTMILGYAEMEEGEEALQMYMQMQREGVVPNDQTFVGALKACSSLAALEEWSTNGGKRLKKRCLEQVRAIHLDIVKSGSESAAFVATMLVDAYAKTGSLVDARQIFERMPNRDVVSWTAMILGYAQVEEGEVALQLYNQMQHEGVVPDSRAFVGALKACGSVAGLEKGKEIHGQISTCAALEAHIFVASSLIDMYGKCGSMADAQQVFDELPSKEVVVWNALIAGYARQGQSKSVFELFERMKLEGLKPDAITFLCILTVCSHVGLVGKGKTYFEAMLRDFDVKPSIDHYTCMVDLLGRAGQLDSAIALVKAMPCQPDGVVWQTILFACQKWSELELGRQAFESALKLDRNDSAAYVFMFNIYASAQMWDDAKKIHSMRLITQAWKQPGQSWWTDTGGIVYTFLVGDRRHLESHDLCTKLEDFTVKSRKDDECVLHLHCVFPHISDDEDAAFWGHSEKMAIAYALLKGTSIPDW